MILTVALAGLFALVPLATNFIIVMTGVNVLHSYMMYASVMPFVLVAYLFDKNIHVKDSVHANRIFITLCCILLVMYIRYDNKCYFLANYAQQEAISYYNTLITRIKSAEGYDDEYPVAFVNVGNIHDASLGGVEKVRRGVFDDINLIPYWSVDESINNYAWLDFMQNWCGYKPNVVDAAEIGNASEIESMPNYPKDGSIKVRVEFYSKCRDRPSASHNVFALPDCSASVRRQETPADPVAWAQCWQAPSDYAGKRSAHAQKRQ